MTYTYIPKGVCSRKMTVELNDDHTIQAVRVEGGCNGNLQGISGPSRSSPSRRPAAACCSSASPLRC